MTDHKQYTIVVQKWEESERGRGTRPDGWTMHLNENEHFAYLAKFTADQQDECDRLGIPYKYTRPDGGAYYMEVDATIYQKIVESPQKMIPGEGDWPLTGCRLVRR